MIGCQIFDLIIVVIVFLINPFLLVIVSQLIDHKRNVRKYGYDTAREIAKRW